MIPERPDVLKRRGYHFVMRRLALLVGLAGAVQVAGCAPGANLPPLPPATDTAYTLGTGDQVRVITFGEQTLTGQFTVDDSGDILIPLLGPVQTAGLTTHQLADSIDDQLRKKQLFRNPSVAVEVVTYRPIFVLGEVNHPGQFPFQPGMTMLSAVAVAGGFTYRAIDDYASIIRSEGGHPTEGKVMRDAVVEPGDVITIFERKF